MFLRDRFHPVILFLVLAAAALACNVSARPEPAQPVGAPAVDATKIALEIQSTMLAGQLTAQAGQSQSPVETATQGRTEPVATVAPATAGATAPDMNTLIQNAKVLVYEDAGNHGLDAWVRSTLDLMGLKYTYDGDAQGNFMSHLNSGTRWDLIIVAAESRSGVQGEFWDVIAPKVTHDKTALIVEMWYLSDIANGRIHGRNAAVRIVYA